MTIKNLLIATFVVVAFLSLRTTAVAADAPKDGKTIFVDAKCAGCHGVTAQGIEQAKKNDKYPDLSTVGDKHNAEFLVKFLNKEEKVNDKAHPVKFKGEAADLTTLATWLAGLKAGK